MEVQPQLSTFSASGEEAINRRIDVNYSVTGAPNPKTAEELAIVEEMFEVESTADQLLKGNYKQIALQFPDELLYVSVPIFRALKRRLPEETGLYVLADTSYGSCCVDEVAAQHIDSDVIVHYGYSCLSKPSRLPVIYVFTKLRLDVQHTVESLLRLASSQDSSSTSASSRFILIPDVAYAHYLDELIDELRSSSLSPQDVEIFYNPVPRHAYPTDMKDEKAAGVEKSSSQPTSDPLASPSFGTMHPNAHRRYTLPPDVPLSSCTILYIGHESLCLTNMLLTHPENMIISYDPAGSDPQARIESVRTNKLLMRRYAAVQRARDADIFGIVVGTLGVAAYLPVISSLRALLKRHKKKSYTLSVGKLNPAKLGNFAEIECFVMVACPENSVIESKDFYRQIITPFELTLALNPEPVWPGTYVLDFEKVLKDIQSTTLKDKEEGSEEADNDKPAFSLVTGKYRYVKQFGDAEPLPSGEGESSSVVLRNNQTSLLASDRAAAEFLHTRHFKGLEQRLGQDAPSVLEEGRRGIARGYQDDHPTTDTQLKPSN